MTVRYLDEQGVTQSILTVTNVQPVGVNQLLVETASTQTPIKFTQLIDIT